MAFRNIFIGNSLSLKVKNDQLIIKEHGEDFNIPLEDISTICIENLYTNITTYALSKFCENNIVVYTCDEKHLPNGVILPFNKHSRQLKVMNTQFNMGKPFIKRVWQNIIQYKIDNQGKCLQYVKNEGEDYLYGLGKKVESGDKGNIEGIAAKYYFVSLFGKGFTRNNPGCINSALNYGYAVIRGAIARTLVSYGLLPSLGIHHHGELNQFNLADDFIEPFRPIVDLWVAKNIDDNKEITREDRLNLYNLLSYNMSINNEKHSVLNAIDKTIQSFISAMQKEDYKKLALPNLIDLEYHFYE